MIRTIVATLSGLALVASAGLARAEQVQTVEGRAADGARYYEDSLVIHAPAATLWTAFTDTAAFKRWSAPVSAVDFRLGGDLEASYDPKGHLGDPQNIKQAFIAYLPERLLVFRNVQAPAGLPGGEVYGKTVKVVQFEPLGPDTTRVTVSGVGFADGPAFDQLYRFFVAGDGQLLKSLSSAFEAKR